MAFLQLRLATLQVNCFVGREIQNTLMRGQHRQSMNIPQTELGWSTDTAWCTLRLATQQFNRIPVSYVLGTMIGSWWKTEKQIVIERQSYVFIVQYFHSNVCSCPPKATEMSTFLSLLPLSIWVMQHHWYVASFTVRLHTPSCLEGLYISTYCMCVE